MNKQKQLKASIEPVTDLTQIEIDWRNLEANITPTFFLSWSWIGPWARLVQNETKLHLFTLVEDDAIVAMCFITLCKTNRLKGLISVKQVQINEYLANKCNMVIQYNGLLASAGYKQEAWTYLIDNLQDWNKHWDEIAVSSLNALQLKTASNAAKNLNLVIDKSHLIWNVPLSTELSNSDKLLSMFKSSSRRKLRQSLKAYEQEIGEISLSAAENLDQALDYFMQMETLHTARWIKAGKKGSFANENWTRFHIDIITNGFPRGEILLLKLSSASTVLGYIYSLIQGDTAYLIQTGFADTTNYKLRPGYVSHFHAMLFCANLGLKNYDFLPDDEESYKGFFISPRESVHWIQLQRPRIKFHIENVLRLIIISVRKLTSSTKQSSQ